MPARAPRHRGGRRAEEADPPAARVGRRGFGRVQEVEGLGARRRIGAQQREVREGRPARSAPLLEG